ncbi:hypothetical protein [Microvirga sp. VF16]|uniref:hypothetical protein n=1 Tax=Microvirga sp. VF16 TaxID=2807101 RepID=UPI00193D61FC|nr:hypothetical protein [Microvirga sp. VF16]QRM33253.1 hypothetical protein JO965_28710 [Microvirga sp. VF16]
MQGDSMTELPLVTGPFDAVCYVGSCQWKRRFSRSEWSHIYIVAHRGSQNEHGKQNRAWTHVYRIAHDTRTRRPVVYLEAVQQSDCMAQGLAKARQLIESFSEPSSWAQDTLSSIDIDKAAAVRTLSSGVGYDRSSQGSGGVV